MKRFYLITAAIIGEVLIVVILLEFYRHFGQRIFWQNLIFLTLAYVCFLVSLFKPAVETHSKEQKWVGMLGMHIMGTTLLLVGTVLTVVCCNISVPPLEARYQLFIFLLIFAVFLISRYFAYMSSEKVGEVYAKEKAMNDTLGIMRKSMDELHYQLQLNQFVDSSIKERINKMRVSMRYISPVGTSEAIGYETDIKDTITDISLQIKNYGMNKASVEQMVLKMESLLQRRKNCFI